MSSPKPTFIFVPGAWHTPIYFTPIIKLLSSPPYSYPCLTIPLLTVLAPISEHLAGDETSSEEGETWSKPVDSFDLDVEAIRKAVTTVLDTGIDVVMIMHSYGGVPTTESMIYFRDGGYQNGKGKEGRGKVLRCVWVSSFVLGVGMSLMDALGGEDLPWFDVDRKTNIVLPINPEQVFYNDIPPTTASTYISSLRPFSYLAMHSKVTYSPFSTIPSTYIICENDQALPLSVQEAMIEGMRASAGEGKVKPFDVVERLWAGHSPFVSQTEILARMLDRAGAGSGG